MIPQFEEPIGVETACAGSPLNDFDICRLVWVLLSIQAVTRID